MKSRRTFIKGALAGGFVLAFHVPAYGVNEPEQVPADTRNSFAPNAFIRIDRSGQTTLVMPQVEMGQGMYTSIAMILAEELDADLSTVVLEHAPPNEKLYINPASGFRPPATPTSIRAFWLPLRKAAAATRTMLIQAAAQTWRVDAGSVHAENSAAIHKPSGRRLTYAALVSRAQALAPPKDPVLKDPREFKLIGRPLKRLDTPGKVNGDTRVRHRCHAAGDEVCDVCGVPGVWRQGRARRRCGRKGDSGRTTNRRAGRPRRRGWRSHLGSQVAASTRWRSAGTSVRTRNCLPKTSGSNCVTKAARQAWLRNPSATSRRE